MNRIIKRPLIFTYFFVFLLALSGNLLANTDSMVMLHCEDENISIDKNGSLLLIHGFGTTREYLRYNNIDHPVLGSFDAEKQNKEKTWIFIETESLDRNYEIIYVFAINNFAIKKIIYERADAADFRKRSKQDPKICFPITNPFN